tara:strand:- start:14 stop:667 length:654 start_codon:yes stop_codon:yes gene_type:complete
MEKSIKRLLDSKLKIEKIFLINDGSTDNSLRIASEIASSFSFVEVINNPINQGKGSALSSALSQVTTTHIAIHDADLEYNPLDIKEMIAKSKENKNSLILGSRFIGKMERNNIYLRTYLANKFLSFLFSLVYAVKVTDVASCYKLFPSNLYKEYEFKEKGFSVEIEMLSKFAKSENSIIEVPISYEGRSYEEGKKIKFSDGFNYIYSIFVFKYLKDK